MAFVLVTSILALLCTVAGVFKFWGDVWSSIATIAAFLLTALVAVIAYVGIPASKKSEARRKTESAIDQYVAVDLLGEAIQRVNLVIKQMRIQVPDTPSRAPSRTAQLNRLINRMRALAPDARYSAKEIGRFLESPVAGEHFAALASVQWQWAPREKPGQDRPAVYKATNFDRLKSEQEYGKPEPEDEDKVTDYFPQLLNRLCFSWDKFENYHAMVAMWSMLDSLNDTQKRQLCERVIDQAGREKVCPLTHTCDDWDQFINEIKDVRRATEGQYATVNAVHDAERRGGIAQ